MPLGGEYFVAVSETGHKMRNIAPKVVYLLQAVSDVSMISLSGIGSIVSPISEQACGHVDRWVWCGVVQGAYSWNLHWQYLRW